MKRQALVTSGATVRDQKFLAVTGASHQAYADHFGLEYLALKSGGLLDCWAALLTSYDQVLYINSSCLIRPDTPSLFNRVPKEKIGWVRGRNDVVVFSRAQSNIKEWPDENADLFYPLPYIFNRTFEDEVTLNGESRLESYIVNYRHLEEPQIELVQMDIEEWSRMAPSFHKPTQIKVALNGGLGDQIDAEPVVREIRRLYPHDEVIVGSTWPELFEDLPYKVTPIHIWNDRDPQGVSQVFYTYPMPGDPVRRFYDCAFTHTTDFSSLVTLRRTLPPEKKSLMIRYRPEHVNHFESQLGVKAADLKNAIVIHPGRSWKNRSLGPGVWEQVAQKLMSQGRTVVLVGQDSSPDSGVEDFPPCGALDGRNKLDLKATLALLDHCGALLTNDSGPLHLAGATDIWILAFFSARHPAFVWPYRNGRQDYKTVELNARPTCWPCSHAAPPTRQWGHGVSECVNYDEPNCCHPTAEQIVSAVEQLKL